MQNSDLLNLKYINASKNRKIDEFLTTHTVLCSQTQDVPACHGISQ